MFDGADSEQARKLFACRNPLQLDAPSLILTVRIFSNRLFFMEIVIAAHFLLASRLHSGSSTQARVEQAGR